MSSSADYSGGDRVLVPLIDLQAQYASIKTEVDAAVGSAITSQSFILGSAVEALEQSIAELSGVEHAVGCASGTDALLLPLQLMSEGGEGDVIVPTFTFFATAGAVWNAGCRPVFCDVDEATFNITAGTLERVWTEETVGVVPVHLFGQMAEMGPINVLAKEKGAFVLEDAAQALGATQKGADGSEHGAGSVGDAGTFSFFPTKNLGGFGDGGMITTNDGDLAARLRTFRVHGGTRVYHHDVVGTNSRLDALQAAVLSAKLPHLAGWSAARRGNAARYAEGLRDIEGVTLPLTAKGNTHIFNQFTLRVSQRDELRTFLADRGIGSGIYYPLPLHLQKCFDELGYREGDFPVSERLCREVVSLPVVAELSKTQCDVVISVIREFYGV